MFTLAHLGSVYTEAKAKKIKEPSEKIKVQAANIKENFRFRLAQCEWAQVIVTPAYFYRILTSCMSNIVGMHLAYFLTVRKMMTLTVRVNRPRFAILKSNKEHGCN